MTILPQGEGIREDHERSPVEVALKLRTGRELGGREWKWERRRGVLRAP